MSRPNLLVCIFLWIALAPAVLYLAVMKDDR